MTSKQFDFERSLGNLFVSLWKLNLRLHGVFDNDVSDKIKTVWERCGIYVQVGNEKKYPSLVEESTDKYGNQTLSYKIPAGMDCDKIEKNAQAELADFLKSEILYKYLENHTKAHFRLTVLKGKLLDHIEADLSEIVSKIKAKGKGLWIPTGYSRKGLELINLATHNTAHLMVGGAIGGGKSTLLRLIMLVLHLCYTPEEVVFWVCDFKHGNEMKVLGRDPLLFDRICTKPSEAKAFFTDLYNESESRYKMFPSEITNLMEYNQHTKGQKKPHIILLIDELGKLEGKEFREARQVLKDIAGDGRASGVHVLLSMHRPTANLVDGTLKNNMPVTIGFRCNPVSARVIFGEDEFKIAQAIDSEVNGRAILTYPENVLIQVPWVSEERTKKVMADYQKEIKSNASTLQVIEQMA